MIRSNPKHYYAELSGDLHVFQASNDRNSFLRDNPTAVQMSSRDSKPRRFRDARLSYYVFHHEGGTIRDVRHDHTTNIRKKGDMFAANVPTT